MNFWGGNLKRILHISIGKGYGGIKTFIKNMYENIDRNKVKCDIISIAENPALGEYFKELGAEIYELPYRKNIIKFNKKLYEIVKENNYDAVHIHKNSCADFLPFIICRKAGVRNIICHGHNSQSVGGILADTMNGIGRKFVLKNTKYKFACSESAAKWIFGDEYRDAVIIKNGVDTRKLEFNSDIRKKIRNKLNIEKKLVIGNIGRFNQQKNQLFLLEIVSELVKIRPKSTLMLIGDGELKSELKKRTEELGISDNVMFMGQRNDVNELLSAMDIFVLPSLYEGLPIVGVEAQANGLPVLMSDTITKEAAISECKYLSLNAGAEKWADEIVRLADLGRISNGRELIIKKGFDICSEAKKLEEFYINIK